MGDDMRFNRRMYIRFVLSLFIALSASLAVSAEESEDDGWFWGKTISEISFEGLKNVKRSELTGITNAFVGRPFTEEVYTDLTDRLYALDMFDDITPFAKHDPK
ncbi:POTRA domain-containing protein, partial [Treponema socranskii]